MNSYQFQILFPFFTFVAQLTVDDYLKVTQYLETLLPKDLMQLGEALGLQYSKLFKMALCGDLLRDVVLAWLNQQDNVMKRSGKATWRSLIKALRTIGHEVLALKISQGNWTNHYLIMRSTEVLTLSAH